MSDADDEFEPGSEAYWDAQYSDGGDYRQSFEWIADPSSLVDQLVGALSREAARRATPLGALRVAEIGCGSSRLTAALRDAGFGALTATDFSRVCVDRMRAEDDAPATWCAARTSWWETRTNWWSFRTDACAARCARWGGNGALPNQHGG